MATGLEQPRRSSKPNPILVDKNGSCPFRLQSGGSARRTEFAHPTRADIHEAFVSIACSLICLRALGEHSETA